MNKKLQIFISSTFEDMIEERQATVMAILDAGHIPAGMEVFKGSNTVKKTFLNGLMSLIFMFYFWVVVMAQ